jgi:TolB protein
MQIWTMQSDGSRAQAVTHFTRAEGAPQCLSWSGDGRRLAVQVDSRVAADTTKTTGHIWIVDLRTGSATQLAKHATPYHDEMPVWFPDGRCIAFASDRTGSVEIWTINIDGSDARQLTRTAQRSAQATPHHN